MLRLSALGSVLALLAGLITVFAATTAVALPDVPNTWIATQNMQRSSMVWSGRVENLVRGHHVVALQEVPFTMPNGPGDAYIPAPPDRASGIVENYTNHQRGAGQLLPALPPLVTEYRWNLGRHGQDQFVYLYLLRMRGHSGLPVGMVTHTRAWNALSVSATGSSRDSLVLLDRDHHMAYATYHANAVTTNRGDLMVQAVHDAVDGLPRPAGGRWNWAVVGDFNRDPSYYIHAGGGTPTTEGQQAVARLGARVYAPSGPTQNGGGTLDYMIASTSQPAWQRTGTLGSGSDHRAVLFGSARGSAALPEFVALHNRHTDLAITGRGERLTPRGEHFRFDHSQLYSLNFFTTEGGHDWFTMVNYATGLGVASGHLGTVGSLVVPAPELMPDSFLWRRDGDTIRNFEGRLLAMSGADHRLWAHEPGVVPEGATHWSIRTVDLDHLSTAGFRASADQALSLQNNATGLPVAEVSNEYVVTGIPPGDVGGFTGQWVLRTAKYAGAMYLVNRMTGKCLRQWAKVVAFALVAACPTAESTPEQIQDMSWQVVGGQILNAFTGAALGSRRGESAAGSPLMVLDEISDRYDQIPVGGDVPSVPGVPPGQSVKLAVMPLGDSITLGVGSDGRTGYRPALAQMLAKDSPSVQFVGSMRDADGTRHEGHSGWRIDQISANIERWMAEAKPNLVLLHIGTNDMNRNHQADTAPQRLAGLIDQIHTSSPSTAIVVASLVPAADRTVQARVDAYNRAIPGIVADRAQRGYRITQVSMGSLTVADLDDNLHPNDRGYRKMAGAFHGGIVEAARKKWIDEDVTVKPAPPGTGTPAAAGDYRVDINGDGRSDYLAVQDNGATRAWTSSATADGTVKWADQGVIASGSTQWTGEQVRFADIGGDNRADYLILAPNGAVRAFINEGGDGRGGWRDIGTVASGSTAWNSTQVRFADIGGDTKADYLIVSDRGAVRAFIHTTAADGTVKWNDQGSVATGSPRWTAEDVRFADIGGDPKADYLIVDDNGATQAYLNTTTSTVTWVYHGHIATGSTQWTGEQVRFADITGDNRADYLILAPNGALTAYENTPGPEGSVRWTSRGIIATGTGSPANRVRI
ncbi:GDSL-type esterase/lipase family protein [Streptomyces sp. CAU 1734]|uniref:GDSL-type esterase/lipase family protein n=1 Tax=Streptomyces sp. CAU 1734 TaxID=3140360 RepID=UPI0032601C5C